LEQSVVTLGDIKIKTLVGSANSLEVGQTSQMCALARLNTGCKGLSFLVQAGQKFKYKIYNKIMNGNI
jgi:hypothetical protein